MDWFGSSTSCRDRAGLISWRVGSGSFIIMLKLVILNWCFIIPSFHGFRKYGKGPFILFISHIMYRFLLLLKVIGKEKLSRSGKLENIGLLLPKRLCLLKYKTIPSNWRLISSYLSMGEAVNCWGRNTAFIVEQIWPWIFSPLLPCA